MRRLAAVAESFPLARPFVISRWARHAAEVVTVTVAEGSLAGRGEATPNRRYGQSVKGCLAEIMAMAPAIAAGIGRDELQAMAPGPARNALDCALWDLEAKRAGTTVFAMLGRTPPDTIDTAFTLSLAAPGEMAEEAARHAARPVLKLKLGAGDNPQRIAAVRAAVPGARLIADANEALAPHGLARQIDEMAALGLELLEQPLPAGADTALAAFAHAVPVCADESCHLAADIAGLAGRYEAVNIKLDKTGGLTGALELEAAARAAGLKVMVGCMVSTSLGLAPAQVLAAGADFVDLDAALYLSKDRAEAIAYTPDAMAIARPALWG
jgi:L-alanine-DL-glutamate epimerase-like enolase superfamily enzyme